MDTQGDEDMLNEDQALARAAQADAEEGFPASVGARAIPATTFILGIGCGVLLTLALLLSDPKIVCQ